MGAESVFAIVQKTAYTTTHVDLKFDGTVAPRVDIPRLTGECPARIVFVRAFRERHMTW